MNKEQLQKELDTLKASHVAKLSDAQLSAIDDAMARHGPEMAKKVSQTPRQRSHGKRKTKLTFEMAETIRSKYIQFIYGRKKLSVEFGVSQMTILKILRNQIFKAQNLKK
jgi:hypothetical protein